MIRLPARCTKQKGKRLECHYRPATSALKRCSRCKESQYIKASSYYCHILGQVIGQYTCDFHELKEKWSDK